MVILCPNLFECQSDSLKLIEEKQIMKQLLVIVVRLSLGIDTELSKNREDLSSGTNWLLSLNDQIMKLRNSYK